jgi:hypothetical protein
VLATALVPSMISFRNEIISRRRGRLCITPARRAPVCAGPLRQRGWRGPPYPNSRNYHYI